MQLEDSVVIVTGASAGIGRATAVILAERGANVVVTARREERLAGLLDSLAGHPGRRLVAAGDIGHAPFAAELVDATLATFGRIDALVNNAGVGYRGPVQAMPPDDMQQLVSTNILGLLQMSQQVIPTMIQQRHGQIVNVSSIISQRPIPDSALYAASKAAVNSLSRSLRLALRPHGIVVTTVYPGLTATEFAEARLGQKGGNRFGLRGVPAERAGQAIVNALRKGQTEVYVTWYDWLFTHVNRLFPRLTDAAIYYTRRWH